MPKVYDKCEAIELKNYCNEQWERFAYVSEIEDYDTYFIVQTQITLDHVERGWRGDITLCFTGFDINDFESAPSKHSRRVQFKDVLCARYTISHKMDEVAVWRYVFLKY